MTNDLDPKLLEILAENITPFDEELEYGDDISLPDRVTGNKGKCSEFS